MSLLKILLSHLMIIMMVPLNAQNDHLQFRFANMQYDLDKQNLSVDIEVNTRTEDHTLYAMNTRFFFEDDYLQFQSFSDFKEGYNFTYDSGKPIIGGKDSAKKMFGSSGRAAYINVGIEVKKPQDAKWNRQSWDRLVTVNYNITALAIDLGSFCPMIVWDKSNDETEGSYLNGSKGVISTVYSTTEENGFKCTSALCSYSNLNWVQGEPDALPFGSPGTESCVEALSTAVDDILLKGFALEQNTPNPFKSSTIIAFTIPTASEVTLNIFDSNGAFLRSYSERFLEGRNEFEVRDPFLTQGVFLYQINTDGYTSGYMKMIKID